MTYYDGKFDSATTELAYSFTSEFLLDDEFGDVASDSWNALVTVSDDAARMIGVPEALIVEAAAESPEITYGNWTVWIQVDGDGFVSKVTAGDYDVLAQAFEAMADEYYGTLEESDFFEDVEIEDDLDTEW